jgi:hypothetical protein
MTHKVRVELPPDIREEIEKAVWAALAACPEDEGWDVAVLAHVMAPDQWEAVASGPKVEPGCEWEVLAAAGRWSRSPDALYTRVFEGATEQDPSFVHDCFSALFRCWERP